MEIVPGILGLVPSEELDFSLYDSLAHWSFGDLLDVKVLEASLSLSKSWNQFSFLSLTRAFGKEASFCFMLCKV